MSANDLALLLSAAPGIASMDLPCAAVDAAVENAADDAVASTADENAAVEATADEADEATAAEEPPLAATPEMLYVQVYQPQAEPPYFRFIIAPEEYAKDFYVSYYPICAVGPEGKGNLALDSGIDIPLPADVTIPPRQAVRVPLGIRVRGLKLSWGAPGYAPGGTPAAFYLMARSSMCKPDKNRFLFLTNGTGLVDLGYTQELIASIGNFGDEPVTLKRGEAVVQISAPNGCPVEYSRADPGSMLMPLFGDCTSRSGGFGSTGAAGSSD